MYYASRNSLFTLSVWSPDARENPTLFSNLTISDLIGVR